jgi:hypothetical protein
MGLIARVFCVFSPCFVGLGLVDSIWRVAGGLLVGCWWVILVPRKTNEPATVASRSYWLRATISPETEPDGAGAASKDR